jgi:hypothetical protein
MYRAPNIGGRCVVSLGEALSLRTTVRPGLLLAALGLLVLAPPAVLPSARAAGGKALDQYFKGTIVALDAKTKKVSIRYDFHDKDQLADWTESVPFPIVRAQGQGIAWFDAHLEIKGNTGARHRAEWTGDIVVNATLTPDADKDMGAYLVPADDSEDFVGFTLAETYFHKWDNKAGGDHSIIKFGKQWREAGSAADFIGFRYVDQRPPQTPLTRGKAIPLAFSLVAGKFIFTLPDFELKGGDRGVRLKNFRPGFYVIDGRILVDDVTITGRLSDKWLEKEGVELRTEKPVGQSASTDVDPDTQGLVQKYASGGVAADALVKVVAEAGKPAAAREAAAKALSSGPKKAVRSVVDLLYSADVDTRTYGIGIVKALLGKDYGFNPRASENSRSGAIQKLNKDLQDHPEALEG